MTQTWRIDGKSMTLPQVLEWKKKRDSMANELVQPKKTQLEEKGYDQKNSIEVEFDRLSEIGFRNLKGDDRKLYKLYKEQLGK